MKRVCEHSDTGHTSNSSYGLQRREELVRKILRTEIRIFVNFVSI